MTLAGGAASVALTSHAQVLLQETDTQAMAFGYVNDAKRVDSKKHPRFQAGQNCGNCALFQGKSTDSKGACPLFGSKHVASAGWCNAWAKKA